MQEDLENTLEIGLEETKTKSTLLSRKRLRKHAVGHGRRKS